MKKHIVLKTTVPGPKSAELLAARKAAIPRGVSNITPIAVAKGDQAGSLAPLRKAVNAARELVRRLPGRS